MVRTGPTNVEVVYYHEREGRRLMARTPIHPGEILADELEEIGLSAKKLADLFEVSPNRLYQVLAGKRNISADTALRLG